MASDLQRYGRPGWLSCRPLVLVDQPAEDLAVPYPHRGQVSDRADDDAAAVWWPQISGSVRAMLVVMRDILIQDRAQVPRPRDQHPVGALGPGRAHPPLGISVRPRAPRRDLHHLDPRAGQHRAVTWKKSHASIVAAWVRSNCRQVVRLRCGAGGIRSRFRTRRTVEAPTRMPRPSSSPWIRLYPQPGFSLAISSISTMS